MGVAKEVWGHNDNMQQHTDAVEQRLSTNWDGDEVSHPHLHNLYRATRKIDPERGYYNTHDYQETWHEGRHRYWTPLPDEDTEAHAQVAWEEAAENAYAHKRPPISDKVRALIHEPHIAADALEEEGHTNLAHMLRHAEHVHTYHGQDAKYPDALFMHNRRPHMVVRGNDGKRYHFVGKPAD